MNYAIIGCGLIGKKRLAGLPAGSKLAIACDTDLLRAEALIKTAQSGRTVADFRQAVADPLLAGGNHVIQKEARTEPAAKPCRDRYNDAEDGIRSDGAAKQYG